MVIVVGSVIGDGDGEVMGHDGGAIGHVAVAVADHDHVHHHVHVISL
jgi:hypothetical protein